MKFENVEVFNIDNAIRGMRNPYDSWKKGDTHNGDIGENDLQLLLKLCKAGSEHRKVLRQIFVSADITAMIGWWKQFDTYKVGTTSNSCSTMHTIMKKEFTLDDFEIESLENDEVDVRLMWDEILQMLNGLREKYLKNKDKKIWRILIEILPESYLQKRTITMNYENIINIIKQRQGHKLQEWKIFSKEMMKLPYISLLCDL